MVQLTIGCIQQVESRTPLIPHTDCSSDSKEGFCTDADWTCSAISVARTCGTFGEACVGLDRHPNATIAEYGLILDKDAMMKVIENRGPIACALDVGSILDSCSRHVCGRDQRLLLSMPSWF